MSNSFPKVSPDGRWIVYVQSRNGQLMRPDGQLYIVPAAGGPARRMTCNTPLMNSWHSFSPDGRWMVFSSKSRSPYTQMFLTHIDEQGNDTPAILIERATDANRAVNLPEFVNLAPGALGHIDAPAAEFYRLYDAAWDLTEKGDAAAALDAWTRALQLDPADPRARTNYAALLLRQGQIDEAAARLREIVAANPDVADARVNFGVALQHQGKLDDAIAQLRAALDIDPDHTEAYANLGNALAASHHYAGAARAWQAALTLDPNRPQALANYAWMLATCPDPRIRNGAEALRLAERAAALTKRQDPWALGVLGAAYAESARFAEAVQVTRHALLLAADRNDQTLAATLVLRLTRFESHKPWRDPK
jgi:Tfp pilus assembly protein PilF